MMGGLEDINVLKTNAEMYGFIGIDVANGYTISVIDSLKKELREKCQMKQFVGNVVTSDMTQELILAGADIIKVGVGPECMYHKN